jgi:hypothetical protein
MALSDLQSATRLNYDRKFFMCKVQENLECMKAEVQQSNKNCNNFEMAKLCGKLANLFFPSLEAFLTAVVKKIDERAGNIKK